MLWGGRFSSSPKEKLLKYNSGENAQLDSLLIPYDIQGSIAHVKMLQKQKILSASEAGAILSALKKVLQNYKEGKFTLNPSLEDVHMNVEAEVTRLTPHGKKMHTARSRNDQVILDTRLYMREEIIRIAELLLSLCKSLESLKQRSSPFPAYTHTRIAQPITLSYWSESFQQSFLRDFERLLSLYSRANINPLGACAVAGTGWSIDRAYTAKLLGFEGVQENAHDVSTSRGELEGEMLFVLAEIMIKLSRISEELIFLSQKGLVSLPDEYCTGSSIMPQKKNADFLEIMRARSSRLIGSLTAILSIQKGLISGYNSDSQETKPLLFSSIDIAKGSLEIMADALLSMETDKAAILKELENGYACATELADLLAKKGVPFRSAHEITGEIVKECIKKGIWLLKLDANAISKKAGVKLLQNELSSALSPDKTRETRFKTAPLALSQYEGKIREMKKKINLLWGV
ncbi:argininosuccinate lyase [Candidatus Micrarchaeota archaeon CG1_02_47_40]|nr:MAG: argininosuccinate lyase [Candidatus Micrarchaeota archaeon CG1_02_47_40]